MPARRTPGPAICPTTSTVPGADINSSASITLICTLVSGPRVEPSFIWRCDGECSSARRGISAVLLRTAGPADARRSGEPAELDPDELDPDELATPPDEEPAPGSTSINSSFPFIAPTPAGSGAIIALASRPYESATRMDCDGDGCWIEKSKLIRCSPGVDATSMS